MVNLVTKCWWREIPIVLVVIEGRLTRSSSHYHVWGLILFCVNVPINSLLNKPAQTFQLTSFSQRYRYSNG